MVWELQTAEALWRSGERIDAIAWLRRAAQAAGDAADDDRALEFARSAADLSDWMATQPSVPRPSASASARVRRRRSHSQPAHVGASRAPPERPEPVLETTLRTRAELPPIALPPARIISSRPLPTSDDEDEDEAAERSGPRSTRDALCLSDGEPTALERSRRDDPRFVLLSDPDSRRAAGFRLLRDNILVKQTPRVIAVSSGAADEGKTTCAINLAFAMCELPGSRILLLEGNFFVPSLGEIFHVDASTPATPSMNLPWLAPYRIAEVVGGLHVAALVRVPGAPAPAFNRRWFDKVVEHLSGGAYDHVIIDAAALCGSPVVTHVVAVADGTLLTVRSGGTTARTLRRAAAQIPADRALGIALMDVDV